MYDGADTVVLYEELAFQDVLPVQWRPLAPAADREIASAYDERNIRLLAGLGCDGRASTDREDG